MMQTQGLSQLRYEVGFLQNSNSLRVNFPIVNIFSSFIFSNGDILGRYSFIDVEQTVNEIG